jgi:DNA-binding CsgD family transcriptional regulator
MTTAPPNHGLGVVGREPELETLHGFLDVGAAAPALVLTGGPGLGKTTLWDATVETARRREMRVLVGRPSDAEATLAFASLIDLFDGVETEELAGLPAPQLHALEVALLRAEPGGMPPQAQAIAVGLSNALRMLAERRRLLIAIDDVQWLDGPSAAALVFAARRIDSSDVRILLARRPGPASSLEEALAPKGLERVDVAPLSLGATRRLLHARLGLSLPRQLMRSVFDATLGNPLFALEVGRKLVDEGTPAAGKDLPLPDAVEDLLGTRVAALPPEERTLLLAAALTTDLRVGQLAGLGWRESLDSAVERGVVVVDGDHVRAAHPLLAAAATQRSRAAERRELHGVLATVVDREELRIRHRALATATPDGALAPAVAAAAASAARRGAPQAAVELGEHALRLTARDDPAREERLLELGSYLKTAGEKRRLTELVGPALASLPPGASRVRAYLLLIGGDVAGNDEILRHLERALAESGEDQRLRAPVLAELAANVAAVRLERIPMAEAWARQALDAADLDADAERLGLYALAWARSLGGRPIDDLCERFRAASDAPFYVALSPERIAGQRHVWRGSVGEAREVLTRLWHAADDRGEPSSFALQRLHVCELELRVGAWDAAELLLDEWGESADSYLLLWPMYERCRALLAAGRGDVSDAVRWAENATARGRSTGSRWDQLEAQRALGTARLLAGEPEAAAETLREVWDHTERQGVEDPGVFPVAPELVEALVAVDDLDEASGVTARVRALAEAQLHPWGRATAHRCAATVQLGLEHDEDTVAALEEAAGEYATLGLAFDNARTLLALGRAHRRNRKWGAARGALQRAAAAFDGLGSPGWADAARGELARVGARRAPGAGELTPAERRVAELAAQGLANKEIAQALVVTVSTVEFHLSKTYAKLGIRSRAQLAGRLASPPPDKSPTQSH